MYVEADFWYQKWQKGEIGFHRSEANAFLVAHFYKLHLAKNSRIFLPLCGKTRDLAWLLASGYRVVGAELSEIAIQCLFEDLRVGPTISRLDQLSYYSAKNINIFVGDIFNLSAKLLENVDAVYDRAALVALPKSMRNAYTSHLIQITQAASQLLITYEYDQRLLDGPPFSINEEEVKRHYSATYQLNSIERKEVAGGLRGNVTSNEAVWLLLNKESC